MVGKKILILDENEASRKFISNLLRQKQFEASSGKEALIVAWHAEPDLISFDPVLSDILVGNLFKKYAITRVLITSHHYTEAAKNMG